MRWGNSALALLLQNLNGLVVLGGAVWLYLGLRGFSPRAADVVAGGLLMALGAGPYLRKRKP